MSPGQLGALKNTPRHAFFTMCESIIAFLTNCAYISNGRPIASSSSDDGPWWSYLGASNKIASSEYYIFGSLAQVLIHVHQADII